MIIFYRNESGRCLCHCSSYPNVEGTIFVTAAKANTFHRFLQTYNDVQVLSWVHPGYPRSGRELAVATHRLSCLCFPAWGNHRMKTEPYRFDFPTRKEALSFSSVSRSGVPVSCAATPNSSNRFLSSPLRPDSSLRFLDIFFSVYRVQSHLRDLLSHTTRSLEYTVNLLFLQNAIRVIPACSAISTASVDGAETEAR